MKKAVTIAVAAGLLLLAVLVGVRLVILGGGLSLGAHIQIAMWLGIVVALVLGVALMSAIFISSRRGYDDIHKDRRKN